jgi:hypothetical protein
VYVLLCLHTLCRVPERTHHFLVGQGLQACAGQIDVRYMSDDEILDRSGQLRARPPMGSKWNM